MMPVVGVLDTTLCPDGAQAAYPAGRPEAATAAVERWLDAKGFRNAAPDAPANVDDRLRVSYRTAVASAPTWLPRMFHTRTVH